MQHFSISSYIKLMQSITCTISLLFLTISLIIYENMFECFLWILVFPRIVGVVGRPCNGMAHALRALESFTTKMLRLAPNGLSMLLSNKLMTFIWANYSIGNVYSSK